MVLHRDLSGLFGLLSVCFSGGLGQGSLALWHKKDGTTLTRSPNLKNLFNEINASDKQNLYLTSPTGGLYYTLLLVT